MNPRLPKNKNRTLKSSLPNKEAFDDNELFGHDQLGFDVNPSRVAAPPNSLNQALRQRQHYDTFIKNSSEGIWRIAFTEPIRLDQKKEEIAKQIVERGIIAECNNALAQMHGFRDPSELIGKRSSEFIAGVDSHVASKVKFAEHDFSITNIETIEKDRLGNIRYFENSYIGEVIGSKLVQMWGIQRDITEKRRLQEQLRISENRYRNLVEQANDLVIVLDERCKFTFVNKKFSELTNFEPSEIIGKHIKNFVPRDCVDETLRILNEQLIFPTRNIRHTVKFITKSNQERTVEISLTTLRDALQSTNGFASTSLSMKEAQVTTGILAIGRDITEEQAVRFALHESEEKYRSLVENSLLGVIVIQNDLIAYANPTACSLFDTTMDSTIGLSLDNFVHPNDYGPLLEKFAEASVSPSKDIRFTIRVITIAGKIKVLDGWAAGITYMGKPAVQAAMVDVTDTKMLEEQLIQSQKMESIGQLASGVAHDFNNLLGSIYAVIGILKRRYAESDPNMKKYVEILDSTAQRAAELTSQLLTFSRQHESKIKPVRLNDVVNNAMKILIRSIAKNIKVESALDPMLYTIDADSAQLEIVIINLSINARDAMPNGGTLRIETSNVEITRQRVKHYPDSRPGKYACLTISDTGVGMDKDTQRRIFEPFFTTKPIGKGTGLGLSIVYGIVKNHKGFINIYSEPGQGTTFKIYFPMTEKQPPEEAAEIPNNLPRGTETILIIDDETTLLSLTKEILQGLGYRVITAEGALAGIESFKQYHSEINLVILDMLMPEMTGSEVYPIIKEIDKDCPVVLATGLSVGEKVDDLISMGVNDVISKPYSVNELAIHVRKTIDSVRKSN
jgi:two-component system cell cycle sensor histidine kinase/response regulator CckA